MTFKTRKDKLQIFMSPVFIIWKYIFEFPDATQQWTFTRAANVLPQAARRWAFFRGRMLTDFFDTQGLPKLLVILSGISCAIFQQAADF